MNSNEERSVLVIGKKPICQITSGADIEYSEGNSVIFGGAIWATVITIIIT